MKLDKIQTAKGKLALQAGFWLALASKLEWVADPNYRAPAGTNGRQVFYNPTILNEWPIGDVVFVALHEIMHCMLCHLVRLGERDRKIANIAMDIVGNTILRKMCTELPNLGMTVPDSACLPELFGVPADITFEETYNLLMKQATKVNGGAGDGTPGQGFDVHDPMTGEDGKPLTPAQKEAVEKDWRVTVQAAAHMARKMGKMPGFMEEFIGELIKPKIDWRSQLAHCMARVTHDESSYRRFNRRHLSRRIYLPGKYNERIESVAYFFDTSGSISSKEFAAGKGAMTDILEDLKPTSIYFGQCDTKLHDVQELTPDDLPLPALTVKGRGGTDMREAFEWACIHEHEIEAFILQTDGYVPELKPALHPKVPVIVILTTDATLPSGWDFPNVVRVVL